MIGVAVAGASGRMGKLIIQNVASADDMKLVAAFDVKGIGTNVGDVRISDAKDVRRVLMETNPDVLVDFTIAHAAVENVKSAAERGVNLVVGTTGFTQEQHAEMERAIDKKVAAVISPNFSVGVNVFWKIITNAARHLSGCDIEIVEVHHRHKKDAPSGTAIKAAKLIGKALGGVEIPVHSIRSGDIVGDHIILYAGDGERMEIKHQAHSRQAFASGVMIGIRWVVNAEKGIHSMDDVLGIRKPEITKKPTEIKQLQKVFWSGLIEYGLEHGTRKPQALSYYIIPVGRSKFHIGLTVNTQKNRIGCELYLGGENAEKAFSQLMDEKEDIEREIGNKLEWRKISERSPKRQGCKIILYRDGDIRKEDSWPELFKWLKYNAEKFDKSFSKRIKKLKL